MKRFSFITKKGLGAKHSIQQVLATARDRMHAKRVTVVIDGKTVGNYRKPRIWTRLRALLQTSKVGQTIRLRTGKRVRLAIRRVPTLDPKRLQMCQDALWLVAHAPSIHYSQRRPYPLYRKGVLPETLDCSGSVCLLAWHAGVPTPAGVAWGYGDTDGILRTCHPITRDEALPGDYVLWHVGSDGRHVAMILKPGADPILFSHGSEGGPLRLRMSIENRYHPGQTATFLRARV